MDLSCRHETRTFHKAFGLLRRFILPALATYYLLHIELFGIYDIQINGVGVFSAFTHFFFRFALILAWANIFCVLADVSTGRELVMRFGSVKGGAVYWPLVAAAVTFPQLVHFVIYVITGRTLFSVDQLSLILIPPISWFIAGYVLRSKGYIDRNRLFQLSSLDFLIMCGAVLAGLVLDQLAQAMGRAAFFQACALLSVEIVKLFVLYYAFFALARKPGEEKEPGLPHRELILINPLLGGHFFGIAYAVFRASPMFFSSIRAFTPSGYRIFELNRVFWTEEYARGGVLVAISCYSSNAAIAYSIARKFRAAGAKVVMGGPHAGLFPTEALEFCDAVVTGPLEGVWGRIVDDYERGSLAGVYQGSCSENDLARLHRYLLGAPPSVVAETLMVTRGCKFRCYFCTHNSILNTASRCHDDVVALLKHTRMTEITFSDSNIFMDPVYTRELLKRLIPLKLRWSACASIDMAKDDETVALLRQSGCRELMVGFEIASGSEEEKRKGKFLLAKDYVQLTGKLKKAGIRIKGQFMFGFPTDNWRGLWRLWKFCFKLFPNVTGVSYMAPIPGSLYYDDAVREDRLINLNWSNYSGHKMVCAHPLMGSPEMLKNAFMFIHSLFFVTTSRIGFVCLLLLLAGGWCLFQL